MKIFIDNQPLSVDLSQFNNLEDFIYYVMNNHISGDKLLTEVKINDVTFSERWPGESKTLPINKIVRVDFNTSPIKELAIKILSDIPSQIEMIKNGVLQASELYRVADEQEANLNFIKVLNALRSFINFIIQIRRANLVDWDNMLVSDTTIDTVYERSIKLIDEIIEVQEDEDWVLLADLLEYELLPVLDKWNDFTSKAKETLGSKTN